MSGIRGLIGRLGFAPGVHSPAASARPSHPSGNPPTRQTGPSSAAPLQARSRGLPGPGSTGSLAPRAALPGRAHGPESADFRAKLESNLQVRVGLAHPAVNNAHAAALKAGTAAAEAGGTSAEMMKAVDKQLAGKRHHLNPQERQHLKYATNAQVISEHYTAGSRYHGDAQSRLSSHNLPKRVQRESAEAGPNGMTAKQTSAALKRSAAELQNPAEKTFKAFAHINGDTANSQFVSIAEDPVAFAKLDNVEGQTIVKKTPVRSDYLIPNKLLTKPHDIEAGMFAVPELSQAVADALRIPSIFHPDARTGAPRIYSEDTPTVAVHEALYLGERHLDTYATNRAQNPYNKPRTTLGELLAQEREQEQAQAARAAQTSNVPKN